MNLWVIIQSPNVSDEREKERGTFPDLLTTLPTEGYKHCGRKLGTFSAEMKHKESLPEAFTVSLQLPLQFIPFILQIY